MNSTDAKILLLATVVAGYALGYYDASKSVSRALVNTLIYAACVALVMFVVPALWRRFPYRLTRRVQP